MELCFAPCPLCPSNLYVSFIIKTFKTPYWGSCLRLGSASTSRFIIHCALKAPNISKEFIYDTVHYSKVSSTFEQKQANNVIKSPPLLKVTMGCSSVNLLSNLQQSHIGGFHLTEVRKCLMGPKTLYWLILLFIFIFTMSLGNCLSPSPFCSLNIVET